MILDFSKGVKEMEKSKISNVGIYVRLSKDDERSGESLSIENQKLILTKYVKEQGWNLIDVYVDDGYSGTTFDRPSVQRLLDDAKCGRINTIVVKDLSRFGRNYIQVGQYTDYIFPMYNIRFIALNDNIDTAITQSTAMDMMPIMNVFNEWHAANTSKKIRAVIEANAKAGKYRTTFAPYGYIKGTDEKKLPIVDEPAAKNVRRIFEMRASGISPKHIADTFNDEHILIPTDYRNQRLNINSKKYSHHLWTCEGVQQILHNPTYLGHLVQMRTTNVSYKNHKQITRPEEERITILNTHEPIISQDLWDKCREIEKSVSQGKKNKTGIVMPLSGLCYCEDCGNKMYVCQNNTRHSRKGPRIYFRQNYNCGNYNKFGTRICTSHYIKMNDINAVVLADIKSKAKLALEDENQARKEFLLRQERELHNTEIEDNKKLSSINQRITELDKLIQSTYEDKVFSNIPEDICVNLLTKYQQEKEQLQQELRNTKDEISNNKKATKDVDEFIKRLKKYIEEPELTREMCLELIEFITIDKFNHDDKKAPRQIHIYYKFIDKQNSTEFSKSKKLCL